ncbi:beclin 1-associated autophagy-related key regulator isoform X2 [Ischnura elegans]|uniref:beclin 1-associated autophagy-related key regulator isoform X2 n=1 Tax=Ischnura elegans TaxID=197161 RepID=UPI001ED8AEB7|nr:beclin 1-associated autophagy-related key regulator isoform X2 [Ischnura elegans]
MDKRSAQRFLFAEKQLRLCRLKKERLRVQELCETRIRRKLEADHVLIEMQACQERIRLLKLLIQEKRDFILKGTVEALALQEANGRKHSRLQMDRVKVQRRERCVGELVRRAERQRKRVEEMQARLKGLVRCSVQQLVRYVFPLSEERVPPESPKSSPPPSSPPPPSTGLVPSSQGDVAVSMKQVSEEPLVEGKSIVASRTEEGEELSSALADASRTAYVRGRWVLTDTYASGCGSPGELRNVIVAPSLPASGDYSAYGAWVAANKDGLISGGPETVKHHPAYAISAALTYTTQLVNVLAYYLDVRLPKKLCYSDFCRHEMGERRFARKVAKLNANVLHLCFSQNVDPKLLHPHQTLQNLFLLLNPNVSDLGRHGPMEVNPELAKSLEDQLTPALEARDGTDDEDSGSDDDGDALAGDWEAVPHLPYAEAPHGPLVSRYPSFMPASSSSSSSSSSSPGGRGAYGGQGGQYGGHGTTSMAGGLVNSAAATIASFWRGMTGQR